MAQVEIGLARPMRDAVRIAALFPKGVDEVDAGFGIDALRLSALVVEHLAPEQIGGGHARCCDCGGCVVCDDYDVCDD